MLYSKFLLFLGWAIPLKIVHKNCKLIFSVNEVFELFKTILSPESIIRHGGLVLLLSIVFAENGIFFGFFLPGDSLLFTAGILTATGILGEPIHWVMGGIFISAFLGNAFGYYFGRKAGPRIFGRKESFFFRKKHLQLAKDYYEKYGAKTLILGRFLPIVRTFAPIMAGVIRMNFGRFMIFNVVGGFLWTIVMVGSGYLLGTKIPNAEEYLGYIIVGLVVFTAIPIVRSYLKSRKKAKKKTEINPSVPSESRLTLHEEI